MDCVFGLVGNDFALIVSGAIYVGYGLVLPKDTVSTLDSHKLMGASGESGDILEITKSIKKNSLLYRFRCGIPMTTAAAANSTRAELATTLHKRPCMVNIVLAGYDKETGPSLYAIDDIATLHKVDKVAFADSAFFPLVTMGSHYRSKMSVEEAVDFVDKCIIEITSRMVVAPQNYVIKIVDKDGARTHAWRYQTIKASYSRPELTTTEGAESASNAWHALDISKMESFMYGRRIFNSSQS